MYTLISHSGGRAIGFQIAIQNDYDLVQKGAVFYVQDVYKTLVPYGSLLNISPLLGFVH